MVYAYLYVTFHICLTFPPPKHTLKKKLCQMGRKVFEEKVSHGIETILLAALTISP